MARKNIRHKRLVIPLRESEEKAIRDMADRERLPAATVARRVLLDLAEATERSSGSKP